MQLLITTNNITTTYIWLVDICNVYILINNYKSIFIKFIQRFYYTHIILEKTKSTL